MSPTAKLIIQATLEDVFAARGRPAPTRFPLGMIHMSFG